MRSRKIVDVNGSIDNVPIMVANGISNDIKIKSSYDDMGGIEMMLNQM